MKSRSMVSDAARAVFNGTSEGDRASVMLGQGRAGQRCSLIAVMLNVFTADERAPIVPPYMAARGMKSVF